MIKSINGWVEDNRNLGMFSKIINGEHVQTYVPPDGNVHRKLALVEAHLTNPMLLRVIPLIFSLMARWRRRALGNAARAVGRYLRGTREPCSLRHSNGKGWQSLRISLPDSG